MNIRPEVYSESLNLVKLSHLVVPKVFLTWPRIVFCVFSCAKTIPLPEDLGNEFATAAQNV